MVIEIEERDRETFCAMMRLFQRVEAKASVTSDRRLLRQYSDLAERIEAKIKAQDTGQS